jgi:UDP-GlcNAc:undecaprenyl-phosphate GlcNAc-1-phosphate transferase
MHSLSYASGMALSRWFLNPEITRWWSAPVAGFVCCVVFTGVLIRIALRLALVTTPRSDRWNRRTVPQFGGIPILLAFVAASLVHPVSAKAVPILLLTCAMGVVGLADDLFKLGPQAKLVAQLALACAAVFFGVVQPLTGTFSINAVFTVLWIVGITNAINLLDNMDGLAAGISIVALVEVLFLGGPAAPAFPLALALAGALVGFLLFNFNPARIFMGDVGSLAIGFFLACASISSSAHLSGLVTVLFVPCLILFIPVFDTLLVSVTRSIHGRRISLGARDHTSHRLVLMGLNERQAVLLLYGIAAMAGSMVFLWKSHWSDLGAGIVSLFLISATLFWLHLAKMQLPQAWVSRSEGFTIRPTGFLYQLGARSWVVVLDVSLIAVGLYLTFVLRYVRLGRVVFGRYLFAVAVFVALKLLLMALFGAYVRNGRRSFRRVFYAVLGATSCAGVALATVGALLPRSKRIELPIVVIDFLITSALLIICRASSLIFDRILPASGEVSTDTGHGREGPLPEQQNVAPARPMTTLAD